MEFTEEFIQENGLTEEQLNAINPVIDQHITTELGTKVHEHTENNLGKIWGTVKDLTGIERENGEKYADAIRRATELHFKGSEESYNRKLTELDDKIKNAKGDETLKQELESQKELITSLKQKEAEYDEWAKEDYKGKYEKASQDLTTMQQRIAFRDKLPTKPESVNKFEWDAKIKEFQTKALNENTLVFDENDTPWLVDKENEFKKVMLEEAIKHEESIQNLVKGRQQTGTGTKVIDKIKIDGVPFDVPKDATPQQRQTAIREYLAGQGIKTTDSNYSKQFGELNQKILGLGKKQAD
jgi:hypothetical protein